MKTTKSEHVVIRRGDWGRVGRGGSRRMKEFGHKGDAAMLKIGHDVGEMAGFEEEC